MNFINLNYHKDHFIVKYGNLFDTNNLVASNNKSLDNKNALSVASDNSTACLTPNIDQLKSLQKIISSNLTLLF